MRGSAEVLWPVHGSPDPNAPSISLLSTEGGTSGSIQEDSAQEQGAKVRHGVQPSRPSPPNAQQHGPENRSPITALPVESSSSVTRKCWGGSSRDAGSHRSQVQTSLAHALSL